MRKNTHDIIQKRTNEVKKKKKAEWKTTCIIATLEKKKIHTQIHFLKKSEIKILFYEKKQQKGISSWRISDICKLNSEISFCQSSSLTAVHTHIFHSL